MWAGSSRLGWLQIKKAAAQKAEAGLNTAAKSAASSMKVVPKKPVAMSMSAKPKFKMTIKPVNLLGGDDDE